MDNNSEFVRQMVTDLTQMQPYVTQLTTMPTQPTQTTAIDAMPYPSSFQAGNIVGMLEEFRHMQLRMFELERQIAELRLRIQFDNLGLEEIYHPLA